jgi:hypothetical protein
MCYHYWYDKKKYKRSLWISITLLIVLRVETFFIIRFPNFLIWGLLHPSNLKYYLEVSPSFLSEVIFYVGKIGELGFVDEILTITILLLDLVLDYICVFYIEPFDLYFLHIFDLEIGESFQLFDQRPLSFGERLHWFNLFIKEVNRGVSTEPVNPKPG